MQVWQVSGHNTLPLGLPRGWGGMPVIFLFVASLSAPQAATEEAGGCWWVLVGAGPSWDMEAFSQPQASAGTLCCSCVYPGQVDFQKVSSADGAASALTPQASTACNLSSGLLLHPRPWNIPDSTAPGASSFCVCGWGWWCICLLPSCSVDVP